MRRSLEVNRVLHEDEAAAKRHERVAVEVARGSAGGNAACLVHVGDGRVPVAGGAVERNLPRASGVPEHAELPAARGAAPVGAVAGMLPEMLEDALIRHPAPLLRGEPGRRDLMWWPERGTCPAPEGIHGVGKPRIGTLKRATAQGSRFLLMEENGAVLTFGRWVADGGCFYSNENFRGRGRTGRRGAQASLFDAPGWPAGSVAPGPFPACGDFPLAEECSDLGPWCRDTAEAEEVSG